RRGGMLQIVKRAAVGDRGYHGAQLQRRHGNAFSEGAHFAYATQPGRNLVLRISAEVFALNVVSGQFTQSELVGVKADFFKSQFASQGLKVGVIGVGQGRGEVHAAAAAQGDLGVFRDQVF